ncbi:MAG: hypothetical protein Q8S20_18610 [Sulfuritalea sp.]|nr:hypothetical protein [Sulfuritalea sp.]
MLTFWKKYYVEPVAYAADYTRWSRNFLNLGIMAVLVSWFFAAGLINIRFAFTDITESEVRSLRYVEGEWLYIGGRNSMRGGIVIPGTKQYLAFVGIYAPTRTGPQSQRKPASGYVYPGVGIVQMAVDGVTVLTVDETQTHFRREAYIFLSLIGFGAMMLAHSASRQIHLVRHQGDTA